MNDSHASHFSYFPTTPETQHPFIPHTDEYKAKRPYQGEEHWGALVPFSAKHTTINMYDKTFRINRSILSGIFVECVISFHEETKRTTLEVLSNSGCVYVDQRPIRKGKEAVILNEGSEIGFYFSETYLFRFTNQKQANAFPPATPANHVKVRPQHVQHHAQNTHAQAPTIDELSRHLIYTPRPYVEDRNGPLSFLAPEFREALLHEFRYCLNNPSTRDFSRISALSRTLLLSAPTGAELFVQRLIRQIADMMHVKVLEVDCTKLSVLDGVDQAPSKSYNVGDRVKYIGRGKKMNEEQLGKIGTVLYVCDGKVAVNFENDANETHGAFVEIDLLGNVDEDMPNQDRRLIGKLPEIIDKNQPIIVCLQRVDDILSIKPDDIANEVRAFINDFKSRHWGILVGCNTVTAPSRSSQKKTLQQLEPGFCVCDKTEMKMMDNAYLMKCSSPPRTSLKSLIKLFGNNMQITPPNGEDAHRWWVMMQDDARRIKAASAMRHLRDECKRVDLQCLEMPERELEFDMTKEDAEKIVGWALAFQARDNIPPPQLTRAALVRAINLHQHINPPKDDVDSLEAENEFEKKLMVDVIRAKDIDVSYDDIGALDQVKRTLYESITLPLQRPELFKTGTLAKNSKGILLFGPPGTGKTMLAKAVATNSHANFINTSLSSLESKWFGEAEKYVKALFTLAQKLSPCVIFIDEVDALLGKRSSVHENETLRKMKNEFMTLWDGLKSQSMEQVIVLGATNRPFDLDDAVLRRFSRRVLVDLPDKVSRERILSVILKDENTKANTHTLAEKTDGYSGSDLYNLCCAASMLPIKEFLANEKAQSGTTIPPRAVAEPPALRPTTDEDFVAILATMSPSTNKDSLSLTELRRWNEKYGQGTHGTAEVLSYFV